MEDKEMNQEPVAFIQARGAREWNEEVAKQSQELQNLRELGQYPGMARWI